MADERVVQLNVGGVYFMTRYSTLIGSDSFFSGAVRAHPNCCELFVDRDPTHFRHVLNWMRGVRCLPDDEQVVAELLAEADYYSMAQMRDALHSIRAKQRCTNTAKSLKDIHTVLHAELRRG